jgi:hypothetical protein
MEDLFEGWLAMPLVANFLEEEFTSDERQSRECRLPEMVSGVAGDNHP